MPDQVNIAIKATGIEKIAQDLAGIQKKVEGMPSGLSSAGKEFLKDLMGGSFTSEALKRNPHLAAALSQGVQTGLTDGFKKAYRGPIPPIIKEAQSNAIKNLLAGAIIGDTNPFLGARFISAAMRGGGFFGGGGGGPFGKLFSGPGGENLATSLVYKALRLSAELLRAAFDHLSEAVKRGAKLFEESARVGRTPGQLGLLQTALQAIGISGSQAETLLLQQEFGRINRGRGNTRRTVSVADEILASGRGVLQAGEIQQIQNMAKYLDQFVKESRLAQQVFQTTSKALFEMDLAASGLKREWHTLWTELATEMSVILKPLFRGLGAVIHLINIDLLGQIKMLEFLKLIPKGTGDEFRQTVAGRGGGTLPINSLQRIGFGFGSIASPAAVQTHHLQDIATATKTTATILSELKKQPQRHAWWDVFPLMPPSTNLP